MWICITVDSNKTKNLCEHMPIKNLFFVLQNEKAQDKYRQNELIYYKIQNNSRKSVNSIVIVMSLEDSCVHKTHNRFR